MKALITGSEGFLGRHFVQALDAHGYDVLGLDILNGKYGDCRRFFRQATHKRFDLVIHAAAVIPDRDTREKHPFVNARNIEMDAAMFQWALKTQQRRVVFFSSCATYPLWIKRPMHEDDIDLDNVRSPDALYGWEKLTGEILARAARDEGLPVTVVRPFSGYGTDQSKHYPFPSFIKRAKKQHNPFVIWGDGTQVRDFVHVDDIVDAVLAAVVREIDGPINIGNGRATNFTGLARLVTEARGYSPELRYEVDKPAGARYRVANTTHLNTFYEPQVTLEEGIARALQGV